MLQGQPAPNRRRPGAGHSGCPRHTAECARATQLGRLATGPRRRPRAGSHEIEVAGPVSRMCPPTACDFEATEMSPAAWPREYPHLTSQESARRHGVLAPKSRPWPQVSIEQGLYSSRVSVERPRYHKLTGFDKKGGKAESEEDQRMSQASGRTSHSVGNTGTSSAVLMAGPNSWVRKKIGCGNLGSSARKESLHKRICGCQVGAHGPQLHLEHRLHRQLSSAEPVPQVFHFGLREGQGLVWSCSGPAWRTYSMCVTAHSLSRLCSWSPSS